MVVVARPAGGALRLRWVALLMLLVGCLEPTVGEIDESCDEEAQPEECEALGVVYDAWDIHVEGNRHNRSVVIILDISVLILFLITS